MTDLDPQLRVQLQKKVARSLTRLKHSLAADVEIHGLLKEMAEVGTGGVQPQLETSLSEILGSD